MKKIFIYSMLFLVSLVTSAQTSNVLSIPDIVMPKGQRMLPVNIDNTDVIAGVQFDFQLPDGVTVIGETATLTERCSGHTVTVKNMGSNLYRVMLFAQPTVALTGTSGTVMNIPVDVPMPYVVGDYPLTISNVVLSGMTGNGVAATVSAGTLTITDIPMTVSSAGYTGVYDEAAHGITVTVTDPEGATIKYGTAAGEYTLTENPTYTNVGTYTVYYQVTKQYYITETGSAQVIITKADVTCTPPTALTPVYTGEPLALVAAGTVNGGEMQYSLDGTTWSATIPTGINVGNYRVYYRVIGDANHNDKAAEYIDVTIAKADITYTAPAALNPVYTGSPLALISTGTANGGQIQYSSDGTTWSTDLPTGINAGSYPVWFRIVADANHNDKAAESFEATIAKADVTYTAPTAVAGLVYSGAAQTLIAAGTAEGGVMQYSLDNATWGTELPQATNAGTYPVYFRVVGDANHNDKAAESINAAIAKADVTFTAPVAVAGLVYSGAAQALITAGTAEGGIMQYSLDGTTWGTELPKGTNAGTYPVYFRVVGDANHNDQVAAFVNVTINKADMTYTPPVGLTLVYTGELQILIEPGTVEGGVMEYSLDGTTWSIDTPASKDIRTYTVYYRIVADANHNEFNEIMSVEATIKGFPVDIAAGEYVTYYSDRTLKLDEAETDAKLYTVTNVTDKTVVVSEITVAAAETPILVYNNSNVAKTVVLVPTDEAPANIAVYSGFKGTLVTKEMPASTTTDYYGCNGKDFVWIRDAGTVKANRCWLEVPKSVNPAPSRSIVGGGDTTGINAIDNTQLPDGIYYDLNGRCLQGQPTKKGLYIMNGKKVIIR